jgi:UDP-N-acetylglucosamine 2-epimerase (non-hydrolysing)
MKIFCVIGTRPEAIKMAPVIQELRSVFKVTVISTGQHRSMLDQTLKVFNLSPDVDFNLMQPDQLISSLLTESIKTLSNFFIENKPDLVLAQGDTTTALASALSSYYNKIPFGHIEAGLRSFNYQNPWPEEINRVLISKLSTYHFCPTKSSEENLLKEGIVDNVYVTGNTVIDSLLKIAKKEKHHKKQILITLHRRENFGKPIDDILSAILDIVKSNEEVNVVFPVHLNPNIKNKVYSILNHERITLLNPLDYENFVKIMSESYLILTDSGGIQEEAPALGIPVLVLRETTERPEAVDCGVVKLVGSDKLTIINETTKLLNNKEEYQKMAVGVSPYGDGTASKRILNILLENVFSS